MASLWHRALLITSSTPTTTTIAPIFIAPNAHQLVPASTPLQPPSPATTALSPPTLPRTPEHSGIMAYTAPSPNLLDLDSEEIITRWSYNISDARSESLPSPSTRRQIVPPAPPVTRPPPPPAPVQVHRGIWEEDGVLKVSKDYWHVQDFLKRTREARRQIPAPSEIIFALAALSVILATDDPAHWIFWGPSFFTTGEQVDNILREEGHRIKIPVAWTGTREWAPAVRSQQLKYEYVVVNKKWYPYDALTTAAAGQKRRLRSSADEGFRTAMQHFNLIENEGPSRRRGKGSSKASARKAAAAAAAARSSAPKRSTRRPAPLAVPKPKSSTRAKAVDRAKQASASHVTTTSTSPPAEARPISPIPKRASTRARRVVTASDRSTPRVVGLKSKSPSSPLATAEVISASTDSDELPQLSPELVIPELPDVELPPPVASMSVLAHSRKRSTSSESTETIAVSDRSLSVTSEDTAVSESSPPTKKRKSVTLVEPGEDIDVDAQRPVKRVRKALPPMNETSVVDGSDGTAEIDQKLAASESVGRPKSTRPRTKKARS